VGVLIIDDDRTSRQALQGLLEGRGVRDVRCAGSAAEAIGFLWTGGSATTAGVEVVLLDVEMPGTNGIELCRRLKADARYRDVPVLMLTNTPSEQVLEAAFAAGASDYLTKPVCAPELLGRLRSALSLKRQLDDCRAREQELVRAADQLRRRNEELRRLAVIDELTGIANRRFFNLLLRQEWGRAAREVHPLSLAVIDIDYFKHYNDHYGHPAGDECLRRVAGALGAVVHRPGDCVARYGGEEFVLLMPHTGLDGAAVMAERLRRGVEGLGLEHAASPGPGRVTISLGVASCLPGRRTAADSLLAAADRAVYAAKHEGRNRVKVFEGQVEQVPLGDRHRSRAAETVADLRVETYLRHPPGREHHAAE
jgi:diguanylate cyclase (GGDEF)-like protein